MIDYLATLSFFLSLSLAITFQIEMMEEIFGNFLNSSRVVDRYFIRILKWRVFCGLIQVDGIEKKEVHWIFKEEVDTLWKNFRTMIGSFFFVYRRLRYAI